MNDQRILYRYSLKEAKRCGELSAWQESHRANVDCSLCIERAIEKDFDGDSLNKDCAERIIETFGFERVIFVLAANIKNLNDAKISDSNRAWASKTYTPSEDETWEYMIRTPPSILNDFVEQTIEAWNKLELFDYDDCLSEKDGELDYTGKVVVIDPHVLSDEYKWPETQLFYARCGFGCKPNSLGRKVFGTFLSDGEETYYLRSEILGIIKDECLPLWAREKLEHIDDPKEESQEMV